MAVRGLTYIHTYIYNIYIYIIYILYFFSLPTDVQAEAIPLILGGGDVLMAAETGSGKTGVCGCGFIFLYMPEI